MVLVQLEVVLYCWLGLVWIGLEECLKKGKLLGFQRKCCQNFVKTPILVLAIDYVIIIQMK